MDAARECLPSWSDRTEAAWRQAWLLLTEALAAETMSPFADGPRPEAAEATGRRTSPVSKPNDPDIDERTGPRGMISP